MSAVSKAQRRFMGMCEHNPGMKLKGGRSCPSPEVAREFSTTKEKGLPEHKKKK